MFRFHTGSIKSINVEWDNPYFGDPRFDSILVRLKSQIEGVPNRHISTVFDSILVRLKGYEFQIANAVHYFSFDSILVRLKVQRRNADDTDWECFDSILVRLKDCLIDAKVSLISKFRFHTGSIKSSRRFGFHPF